MCTGRWGAWRSEVGGRGGLCGWDEGGVWGEVREQQVAEGVLKRQGGRQVEARLWKHLHARV
eukprot:1158322-Pelagomonas_calceolata.AAC.9